MTSTNIPENRDYFNGKAFGTSYSKRIKEIRDNFNYEYDLRKRPYNSSDDFTKYEEYKNLSEKDKTKFRKDEIAASYIEGLEKEMQSMKEKYEPVLYDRGIIFIKEGGILEIQGKQVVISTRKDTREILLLDTLFKDRKKVWYRDDILEDWEYSSTNITPRKILYTPSENINIKVYTQAQIKDFLKFGIGYVQINPEYLQ